MIEELIAGGFAYESDGDVYYRVRSYPEYGAPLPPEARRGRASRSRTPARRTHGTSRSGRRTSPVRTRRGSHPGGTAARAGTSSARRCPRSTSGPSFEIHGGGMDLVFPHHENEIAQSRALGHDFARIWMHNGMLEHGRGGDAQVRRQRRAPDGGARPVRARDRAALLHDRSVAEASRLLGSDTDRGEGAGRDAPQRAAGRDPLEWRLGRVRRRAGGRLQHPGGPRDPA